MGNDEVPNWLKELPLAPEYHPTDTEFEDPIAYISKIEKEASAFGICKIIPPFPKPSKKYVLSNLNKSLSKCPDVDLLNVCSSSRLKHGDGADGGETRAVFTTRHQELGQSLKRVKGPVSNPLLGAHKQVWQSGEIYTLEEFESKSKAFARNLLGMIKEVSPLVVEAMFWKAASEKPIRIEYANDVPGSGFGELEGQSRSSHRQRRKRASFQRRRGSSSCEKNEMVEGKNNHNNIDTKDKCPKEDHNLSSQTPELSNTMSSSPLNKSSRCFRGKSSTSSNDVEGTAGWKLSNSPWNLQVIARSPGSLTRFMPDDIPGVTSPMVYIAMLFSWFAWHVEDHELHSMNFLHIGSPKTWYAVPGDYAFAFEEIIRTEAYGNKVDRLAALTLLGEKTTLLSPHIVVASNIPCFRLVQNPGEFVVTFPRAYHVGFSHGFNCGEAANFGTPQWLKVAKEAAVRRAAMSHLPMLSHQQLLYLLTMSFVSRVPRSLLPGARSSRLRDRQKEERELLVKNAFIEDMLRENKTLSVILGRLETCHTVLWDPDLLPRHYKEPHLAGGDAVVSTTMENICHDHSENNNDNKQNNLFEEMSLYMESLKDGHVDDADLLTDFQVDSGSLACVACGILGFPFMSIVQPLTEFHADDNRMVHERSVVSELNSAHPCTNITCTMNDAFSGDLAPDLSQSKKQTLTDSLKSYENGWNSSCKHLRPRLFCLEHTVKVQELLEANGGANILVIVHKDYQKIKANATAIALEHGGSFRYKDIPLKTASQEDLNLIDLAINDEAHDDCGEDWTSNLGVNLEHCVKLRKNSSSKQVQQALALGGLFSAGSPTAKLLNMKWMSRRSRSKMKLNQSCVNVKRKTEEQLRGNSDCTSARTDKLIQYSRRNKLKPSCPSKDNRDQGFYINNILGEVLTTRCGELSHRKTTSRSNVSSNGNSSNGNCISSSDRVGFSPAIVSKTEHDIASAVRIIPSDTQYSEESNIDGKTCSLKTSQGVEVNGVVKEIRGEENVTNVACNLVFVQEPVDRDALSNKVYDLGNSLALPGASFTIGIPDERSDVCDHVISIDEAQQEMQVTCSGSNKEANISNHAMINQPTPYSVSEVSHETHAERSDDSNINNKVQQGIETSKGIEVGERLSGFTVEVGRTQQISTSIEAWSDVTRTIVANENVTRDIGPEDNMLSLNASNDEVPIPCSTTFTEELPVPINGDEVCLVKDNRNTGRKRSTMLEFHGTNERKRKKAAESKTLNELESNNFVKSPCEGLRSRVKKDTETTASGIGIIKTSEIPAKEKVKRPPNISSPSQNKKERMKGPHKCEIEGCPMRFETKEELRLHKRNICPNEECLKKFRTHRYAVLHQRVHDADRPLQCPWKDCSMTFKWAWARTEHIRVHTGERPYKCKVDGCGLSFRFVSDFSRHRRKTGHYVKSPA